MQRTSIPVVWSCRLLFAAFTFVYIYCLQSEMLSVAQHVFSQGRTTYSPLAGAAIITLVLTAVQALVSRLFALPLRSHALTYVPSFLLMCILTSVNQQSFSHFSLGQWVWIAPLVAVLYAIAAVLVHKLAVGKSGTGSRDIASVLWPNYLALVIMMLISGSVPSTSDVYYYEIKTERLISEGRYDEALLVGRKHLDTSPRLSQFRAYALARTDRLPHSLFSYPQLYGSASLLQLSDTSSHYRVSATDIRLWLGDSVRTTVAVSPAAYFSRLMTTLSSPSRAVADYYLCAQLLDGNLVQFINTLNRFYTPSDTLPPAYSQAVALCASLSADSVRQAMASANALIVDTLTQRRYADYRLMCDTIASELHRANLTRRKFGDTYWWYYEFGMRENR